MVQGKVEDEMEWTHGLENGFDTLHLITDL